MISFEVTGDLKRTKNFLETSKNANNMIMSKTRIKSIAEKGVSVLKENTPKLTGATANAWSYEIKQAKDKIIVSWNNNNTVDGVNIAIILQYGHGTKNGGYVQGIDYINPALKPIFNDMASDMWRVVTSS